MGREAAGTPTRREPSLGARFRGNDAYGLLLILIVVLSVATAVAGDSRAARLVVLVLQSGVLLFALSTSGAPRRARRIALVGVPSVLTIALAAALAGGSDVGRAVIAGAGAALAFTAIVTIARRLVSHAHVDGATILGALGMYLLIGILFASVFTVVAALVDGPFFVGARAPGPADFLYFSFATLTTVGYGDLAPAGDVGRMLAVTEALLGQLFLVTVVALVVGSFGRRRGSS